MLKARPVRQGPVRRWWTSLAGVAVVSSVCAVAVLIAAYGGAAASAKTKTTAKSGGTLTVGLTTAPSSLNPAKSSAGSADDPADYLAYEPLLVLESKGKFGPGLASSWGYTNAAHTNFKMVLQKGVKFSDGTPVTADAVKEWLTYFNSPGGAFANQLGKVDSITTEGRYNVTIHLAAANPGIEWDLSGVNELGDVASTKAVADPSSLSTRTDGAGPYVLKSAVPGSSYTYVPNKHYFDPSAIHYSKIVLKVISSPTTMEEALASGQIDVAEGSASTASAAKAAGFKIADAVEDWDGLVISDLSGKVVPALGNEDVRQALNYAIDRPAITKALLGSYGDPTSEWITTDGYVPGYQNHYSYDPAKAKQLLAAAGYGSGLTFTVASTAGTWADGTPGGDMTEAVAQNLSAVGVTLNIENEPSATAEDGAILSGQVGIGTSGFGIDPTAIYYGLLLAPTAAFNLDKYVDASANALYAKAATSAHPDADWEGLTRQVTNAAYVIPVYAPESLWFVKKDVDGVAFPISNGNIGEGAPPVIANFYPGKS